MPDLCEIVAKVKNTKENLSETTIIVFNFFNFFNYLGGGLLGGCLSEVGSDSYVVPLPDRGRDLQNS